MFAKLAIPSILSLVFMLSGLFFGANSASAQTLSSQPVVAQQIKINGAWKSVGDAAAALQQEINTLDQILANSNPSNVEELKMRLTIYSEILVAIQDGTPIPVAAYNAFYKYKPINGVDVIPPTPGIPQFTWNAIYADMINLLLQ